MSRPGAWEIPDYEIMLHFWRQAKRQRRSWSPIPLSAMALEKGHLGQGGRRADGCRTRDGDPQGSEPSGLGPASRSTSTLADALDYALRVVGRVFRREKEPR